MRSPKIQLINLKHLLIFDQIFMFLIKNNSISFKFSFSRKFESPFFRFSSFTHLCSSTDFAFTSHFLFPKKIFRRQMLKNRLEIPKKSIYNLTIHPITCARPIKPVTPSTFRLSPAQKHSTWKQTFNFSLINLIKFVSQRRMINSSTSCFDSSKRN